MQSLYRAWGAGRGEELSRVSWIGGFCGMILGQAWGLVRICVLEGSYVQGLVKFSRPTLGKAQGSKGCQALVLGSSQGQCVFFSLALLALHPSHQRG